MSPVSPVSPETVGLLFYLNAYIIYSVTYFKINTLVNPGIKFYTYYHITLLDIDKTHEFYLILRLGNPASSGNPAFFFFFLKVGPPKEDILSDHLLWSIFQSSLHITITNS